MIEYRWWFTKFNHFDVVMYEYTLHLDVCLFTMNEQTITRMKSVFMGDQNIIKKLECWIRKAKGHIQTDPDDSLYVHQWSLLEPYEIVEILLKIDLSLKEKYSTTLRTKELRTWCLIYIAQACFPKNSSAGI